MANPDQLAILRQGAKAWRGWRKEHPTDAIDLRGADLSGADLRGADLRGADLREADLHGADLRGADLHRAVLFEASLREADLTASDLTASNLAGADLIGACLTEASLQGSTLNLAKLSRANLRGAVLWEASLREADLSEADLHGADLSGTDLRHAVLRGLNLREAHLLGTGISGLDLNQARNLAEVVHDGPSHVGTDTLEMTAAGLTENRSQRGEIETFLRGAGVSERYMEVFGYSIGQAIEFYSCFISYSAEDKAFARRLYDGLQGQGIRCWLDEHQILPGDDIYEQIDRGIRLWDKTLLCCSETSLTSWWVEREIEKAFKKEREILKQQDRRVLALIPLALDKSLFSWESGKASVILERHAADFSGYQTDSAKFDDQFDRVVRALRADKGGRPKVPKPKL